MYESTTTIPYVEACPEELGQDAPTFPGQHLQVDLQTTGISWSPRRPSTKIQYARLPNPGLRASWAASLVRETGFFGGPVDMATAIKEAKWHRALRFLNGLLTAPRHQSDFSYNISVIEAAIKSAQAFSTWLSPPTVVEPLEDGSVAFEWHGSKFTDRIIRFDVNGTLMWIELANGKVQSMRDQPWADSQPTHTLA